MWTINTGHAPKAAFKKCSKNHRREHDSCFANLDKVIGTLNIGKSPSELSMGFFRSESNGLYRIGQTELKHAKETRLYVYPHEDEEIMYILGIGHKESQKDDIKDAKKVIRTLRKQYEESSQAHDQEDN